MARSAHGVVLMMTVWVWVDDRVMEEEDLGGVGKACSCSWGFGLKWLILVKMVTNPKDEEEEGFCWLTGLKEKE